MKKLSLKPNAFSRGEVLTRAQLKKVMGGVGSAIDLPDECKDSCGGALGNCSEQELCRDSECTDKNGLKKSVKSCFHA